MDFVISKVAMSVCALLVVGVLGGCMDPTRSAEPERELEAVVDVFCDLVDRMTLSGSDASVLWCVPCLSDGEELRVAIRGGVVVAEGGGGRSVGEPVSGIHTWRHSGMAMNTTGLTLMDSLAPELVALSGESILLTAELVLLDNEPTRLAFARVAD